MRISFTEFRKLTDDIELSLIIEGIDINNQTKTVKFNSGHQENVDTSHILNPTYSKVDGIEVISIFKRKFNTEKNDGSPLIHALKGNYNWKIDDSSITELFKNFVKISKKIKPNYDTVISIESSSALNNLFLHRLNKIVKSKNKITDLFFKLDVSDVYEQGLELGIPDKDFNKLDYQLKKILKVQNTFTYKMIDADLRKYICKSCDIDKNNILSYEHLINDKDILILDDTITTGKSISDSVKVINEVFKPKSITVITLFSAL